jgi:hypothetical protein
MTETREVWVNVYRNVDGSLATGHIMHPSHAKAEMEGALSSYRVGLNRMVLRAEYDKAPVPQEIGALVGKRIKRKDGAILRVIFDRKVLINGHAWPIICVDEQANVSCTNLEHVHEVLED